MTSATVKRVPSLDEASTFSPQQIVDLVRSLNHEVEALKHQLEWFKRQVFGQKSERRIVAGADGQMSLGEALSPAQTAVPPPPVELPVAAHTRRVKNGKLGNGDEAIPFFDVTRVPVEIIELAAPEAAGLAPEEFEVISHKDSYRLAQRPGSYVVINYRRPVIKLKATQAIVCPSAPAGVIEGSRADVSFVAGLLLDKFAYHLPFYRQHQRLGDCGITVSRPWLTQVGQQGVALLEPIYDAQFDSIRSSRVKAMDETPIKAGRSEPGKLKAAYFWPVYGQLDEVCFPFFESRRAEHVEQALGLTHAEGAVLLSDGYAAYTHYANKTGITHAQCWAHYLESRFILGRWPEMLDVDPIAMFARVSLAEQTRHKICCQVESERRVGGWRCRFLCGRSRVSRHTSRAVSGAMPVCLHVPCIRPAAVHSLAMAATRA